MNQLQPNHLGYLFPIASWALTRTNQITISCVGICILAHCSKVSFNPVSHESMTCYLLHHPHHPFRNRMTFSLDPSLFLASGLSLSAASIVLSGSKSHISPSSKGWPRARRKAKIKVWWEIISKLLS